MSLTITHEPTIRMAQRLAALTGQDIEAAIGQSVEKALGELDAREADIQARIARARAISAEIRAGLTGPVHSSDHNDLYDENGLPG